MYISFRKYNNVKNEIFIKMLLFYDELLQVDYLPDILYLNKFSMNFVCLEKYISIIRKKKKNIKITFNLHLLIHKFN